MARVPSRRNLTGVRTITIAFNYTSSSKQKSDDFFAAVVEAIEKTARNRKRAAEHDTVVNEVRTGRITWDDK